MSAGTMSPGTVEAKRPWLVLTISADNQYFTSIMSKDGQLQSTAKIEGRGYDAVKRGIQTAIAGHPDIPVLIREDADSRFASYADALAALSSLGLYQIGIETKKAETTSAASGGH